MSDPFPDIRKIYRRMGQSLHRGRGLRLSADDVRVLVYQDDAVGLAMANICGYPESPSAVEEHGPKPATNTEAAQREHGDD